MSKYMRFNGHKVDAPAITVLPALGTRCLGGEPLWRPSDASAQV